MTTVAKQAFALKIGRRVFRGDCIAECVNDYNDWKDIHDFGASEIGAMWPISENGTAIGTISYNGRFWPAAKASS